MSAYDTRAIAWFSLWIWPSHLGLPLLLAICILSPRIARHPSFLNMILAEIVAGLANAILLYTGHWRESEVPPYQTCLVQASLLSGSAVMTSVSQFALVYQVFVSVRGAFSKADPVSHAVRLWLLIVAPYVFMLFFSLMTILLGAKHPQLTVRNDFLPYCQYTGAVAKNLVAAFAGFPLAATLLLEAWIVYIIFKHRKALHNIKGKGRALMDTSLRIIAFAVLMTMALLLILISLSGLKTPAPDLIMSTMGTFLFFIFGTQQDVIRCAQFWRRGNHGDDCDADRSRDGSQDCDARDRRSLSKTGSFLSSAYRTTVADTPITPAPRRDGEKGFQV